MWKDYEIAAEDIDLYRALIPERYIGPLWEGSLSGLAFIDKYSGDSPLVGIVLYRITNGYIEIEWVSLTEDHDIPDHGADMIRIILNKARIQGDFRGVFGRFREGDMMSEYFYDDQFVMSREPDGVFRFRLSDVTGLNRENKRLANCLPLSKTDEWMKQSILNCIARDDQLVPLSHPVKWDIYDQDISAVYHEGKEPGGLVLVENNKEELVLSLLYSKNPVAGITLLKYAFQIAMEKYGNDREAACPVLTAVTERLVEKIVQDPKREELIRAQADFPVGTGTLVDFVKYHPKAEIIKGGIS